LVNVSGFLQFVGNLVFIVANHVEMPHGMMEWWNTGYKKRKKIYSTKNVVSTFYDGIRQTSILCFRPRKYAAITRKSIRVIFV